MREADRLEKPREHPYIARPPLQAHFLVQVERGVGAEHVVRPVGGDHQWQQAPGQRRLELEVIEFRGHERMQCADDSTSSEEVNTAAPQLAGAGAAEHKAPPILRFKKSVDHVQEFGHILDFVENHGRAPRLSPDEVTQSLGPRGEFARDLRLEEVDDQRVRQGVTEPGRLAGPPGPEQEEALPGRVKKTTL